METSSTMENSTYRTEVRKELTTSSTTVEGTTEEMRTTQQSSDVPQRKADVTSQEPKITSFTTTGQGDETTILSSVNPVEKDTTKTNTVYSTKPTTGEIVEATSEAAVTQTREPGSTDRSYLAVSITSQAQSSIGPSTSENPMRQTTPEGLQDQTSELVSSVGPSIESTENSMLESTQGAFADISSEPTSTIGSSAKSTKIIRETASENVSTPKAGRGMTSKTPDKTSNPVSTLDASTKSARNIMTELTSEPRFTVRETSETVTSMRHSTTNVVHEISSQTFADKTSKPASTAGSSTESVETTKYQTTFKTPEATSTVGPPIKSTEKATSQVILGESSQPVSTMGPSTNSPDKAVYETTSDAVTIETSESVSTVGPSTEYTEKLMRETTPEASEVKTSEPDSTVRVAIKTTEKALVETTSIGAKEETSEPAGSKITEKPMVGTTSGFGLQSETVSTTFSSSKYTESILGEITSESSAHETSESSSTLGPLSPTMRETTSEDIAAKTSDLASTKGLSTSLDNVLFEETSKSVVTEISEPVSTQSSDIMATTKYHSEDSGKTT